MLSIALVLGCIAGPGCRRISTRTLTDTEARTFKAECDREGVCSIEQTGGPRAAKAAAFAVHAPGRLVALCDVAAAGAKPESTKDCRAIECKAGTDCPPGHGLRDGSCLNGLCIEPENPLGADDAVLLCLAGKGLGHDEPRQVEAYAMGLNCGSPCRVPRPCRQP